MRLGRDLAIDPKLLAAAAERIAAAGRRARPRARRLLVVVGRGTNDPDANSNITKLARMLWEGMGFGWAETAFSGVAHPRVDAALDRAARLGFRRIVVFPYFLFTGVLVKRIYAQTDAAAARFPEIEFVKAPYLRDHPLVLDAFVDRVAEIERRRAGDELPALQIPHADRRLRGRGRRAAAGPSPSRARHRHRCRSSPSRP